MAVDWELHESGPPDAERTVLLLPGGMSGRAAFTRLTCASRLRVIA